MRSGGPKGFLTHPPSDGASQWIQRGAEQPDRHPTGSAWTGSDANDRIGLAIQY